MQSGELHRLRITFTKGGPTRWIGHLDLSRTWERALNRARIPMAYTQGFNRRPRMQFANALPLGYTSRCEYIDLWLTEQLEPADALQRLRDAMAPGIELLAAQQIIGKQPALPTLTATARYRCQLTHNKFDPAELQQNIDQLLATEKIMWDKAGRKNKGKQYDLRSQILELNFDSEIEPAVIDLHLTTVEGNTGRPAHILAALGLDPLDSHVERTDLILIDNEVTKTTS